MTGREHRYAVELEWTGNTGAGTSAYAAYGRDHVLRHGDKPELAGSADPAFRGDPARWNPEDLMVASLSACHQLWYLALCARAGVTVTAYTDAADGRMLEAADGGGAFVEAVLRPRVTVAAGSDLDAARRLHDEAHRLCYIARSVNFPVRVEAEVAAAP